MAIAELLKYPELVAAAAVAVAVPATASVNGEFSAPVWLAKPAMILVTSLPERYLMHLQRMLIWANLREPGCMEDFCSAKLVLALVLLLASTFVNPLFFPAAAAAGYLLPDVLLLFKVRSRQTEIRLALPQVLDLMVMCVDAGLAIDATVQRVAMEKSGAGQALNEEFSSLGRDLLLGTEREFAYQSLFQRTGVEELKTLGSALNQSAKMGLSISKVLRAQGEFQRNKQRLNAEEKAMKLPIYMAFPMWFCIMPALLIVVLAPSIITFLGNLGRL